MYVKRLVSSTGSASQENTSKYQLSLAQLVTTIIKCVFTHISELGPFPIQS